MINLKTCIKKISILIACSIFAVSCVSAQPNVEDDLPELNELEELLLESEAKSNSLIQPELQQNFVILESAVMHELNPQLTSYSSDTQLLTGLYEGLFSYNPITLEPQFAIATDYKLSRDKKRISFTLRQDAYFSNGDKITAQTVKDSWIRLLAEPDAPYSSLLDIIRGAYAYRTGTGTVDDVGIVVASDYVLSVYLNSPANYLPKVLCHSAFSVVSSKPSAYSGAYMVDEYVPGKIVLKKNPYYWDKANTHLEKITFLSSNDIEENAFMFNCGLADWITESVDATKLIDISSLQSSGMFGTSFLFFKNSCKKPQSGKTAINPWDYQEFRSALFEAFPWELIRKDALMPAKTLVYPLSGYPAVEGYDYTDIYEGTAKMKAAKKQYGIAEDEIIPLTLELSDAAFSEETLESLKNALLSVGVELKIITKDAYSYLRGVAKSDSDLFIYTWIGDFADPLAFLLLFQGDSTLNDSGWKNAEYDELIKKAAECAQDADRYKLLAEAETILLDNAMIIPIYHPVSFNVIDVTEVGGWYSNAFDTHPLKYLFKKPEIFVMDNVVIR